MVDIRKEVVNNSHVDEAGAGIQMLADIKCLIDILSEDPRSEAVLRVVCPLHHALHVPGVKLGDAHDGSEALLLGQVHVVLHVTEDGQLHEEASTVASLASQDQSGALGSDKTV